jgi:hypothetical protein
MERLELFQEQVQWVLMKLLELFQVQVELQQVLVKWLGLPGGWWWCHRCW